MLRINKRVDVMDSVKTHYFGVFNNMENGKEMTMNVSLLKTYYNYFESYQTG